jgi:hypothetical protein
MGKSSSRLTNKEKALLGKTHPETLGMGNKQGLDWVPFAEKETVNGMVY